VIALAEADEAIQCLPVTCGWALVELKCMVSEALHLAMISGSTMAACKHGTADMLSCIPAVAVELDRSA
jgi:hypothetical protein